MGRVCMVRDLVAELVMGRVCYGPSLSWAEFVMGRDVPESYWTLTAINRISTGDVTHEFRTNCMLMDRDRTSDGRLCPFCPVEKFEHAQNLPPDGTLPYKERIHRIRNGHKTDTNGREVIKLFFICYSSVSLV